MSDTFENRVVVVTGAAGGVGRTVTLAWLTAGASVLAVDATQANLDGLRTVAAATPGIEPKRMATLAADVTSEQGATLMFAEAQRGFGKPADTLLHLVGGFGMADFGGGDSPAVWDKQMKLNLTSSFHAFRAALPGFRTNGGGYMVALASRAVFAPPARMAAYAASKAGLIALAQSLSAEVRSENIHVNIIVASTIDTPANRDAMGADQAPNWVAPTDIADATMYLCSDRARAVHGATLEVYGKV